jgi:4-amino-4-deoxychorismate lyase
VEDLHAADAVFLASSVRKVTRVHTLDGKALPKAADIQAEITRAYESEYAL